jgi:hypothetical protein
MSRDSLINQGGHFLLLQIIWPAAVLGAAAGMSWPAFVAMAAMPLWSAVRRLSWRADLRMLVIGVLVGLVFEPLLIGSGLIVYALQPSEGWVPAWILFLWGGFAINFNHCLAWLQGRWWFAALFGLLGAPLSVLAGVSLGAAQAPVGLVPLAVVYGIAWGVMMPLLAWAAWYFAPPINGDKDDHASSVV